MFNCKIYNNIVKIIKHISAVLILLRLTILGANSNISIHEDSESSIDNRDSIIRRVFSTQYDNQLRIESNTINEKSIIAVRFRSCIALGYLRKKPSSNLIKVSAGGDIFTTMPSSFVARDRIVNITDSFIAAVVSVSDVDGLRARSIIERMNRDYQRKEGGGGIGIGASLLSARLADLAHENTMYPSGWATSISRLPAVNVVTVDPTRLELYLVDLSGNRFACRSVGAGFNAERVNHWLETRGRYLATSLPEVLVNCSRHWNISDDRCSCVMYG